MCISFQLKSDENKLTSILSLREKKMYFLWGKQKLNLSLLKQRILDKLQQPLRTCKKERKEKLALR